MLRAMLSVFEDAAHQLGATLVSHSPLSGGVVANVQRIDLAYPDGRRGCAVVRQVDDAAATRTEFALLRGLFGRYPAPRPLHVAADGAYLLMEHVDGAVETDLARMSVEVMADRLAELHALRLDSLDLPELPPREDLAQAIADYLPAGELRSAVESHPASTEPAVLLHGDYWPGNILWRRSELVAVIDWSDAALGDPLSDLACARAELCCAFDGAVVEAFTRRYVARRGLHLEPRSLAVWEVYVSASALKHMPEWGLPPAEYARRRERTAAFLRAATDVLVPRSAGA